MDKPPPAPPIINQSSTPPPIPTATQAPVEGEKASEESSGWRGVLYWTVPAAGFFVGALTGGMFLSFLFGIISFVGLIFVDEKLTTKRTTDGFFLRHRGSLLEFFVTVLGIFIGIQFGEWGWIIGYVGGMWVGSAISGQLGWSQEVVAAKADHMAAYIGVLTSAANADQNITDKEKKEISETCRVLFSSLGLGDDEIVSSIVSGAVQSPVAADVAAAYVATLPAAMKQAIQSDVLRILFCSGELTPVAEQWLGVFVSQSAMENWALLHLYTRKYLSPSENRTKWLEELELSADASEEQIKSAYRTKALDYHPDRLQSVPPQIRALAEAKMIAINEAYQNLLKSDGDSDQLFFKTQQGVTMQINSNVESIVACWLCNQFNRIPHIKASKTARCGKCHSLLGITFDPNKT